MVVKLYIGNDKLDLFKDETIIVKSSITDAQDISKNVGDYSFTFTVSASSINNRIFKHYYDADIDNTFDARVKVAGRIELDGLPFKVGKWRLSKVTVKKGKPTNYTISFFGRLVSFKTLFKKDELSILDFSAFDHDFDSLNVKAGLTDGLFGGSIKYPLIAKKQYYYNSDPTDTTNTADLSNIAFNGATVGVKWDDLQPSIKLIDIIEAIEAYYSITFSRDFFGRSEFDALYLWGNKDKERGSVGGGTLGIDWDSGDTTYIDLATDVGTYEVIIEGTGLDPYFRAFILLTQITPDVGFESSPYSVIVYADGEEVSNESYVGNSTTETNLNPIEIGATTKTITWQVVSNFAFAFTSQVTQFKSERASIGDSIVLTSVDTFGSSQSIDTTVNMEDVLPKVTIVNFLRDLFKLFKLVVIPTSDTEIYVNTLNGYYAQGRLQDVTRYVDFSSYDVKRGNIFNELNFKFAEPETILQLAFEENTGLYYGDEELKLADENGEPLDGTKSDIKVLFEQVIYERLPDLFVSGLKTNVMYGAIIDDSAEATTVKPHIHYIVNQEVGTETVGFINDAGTVEELSTNINVPSHTIDFGDKLHSTIFSAEYSNWDGEVINNTLYKNYYEDYILSIFNIKRRSWKFDAILPLNIIASLQLNDIIKIKERFYRINSYNLNLTNGVSTLDLINSFDNEINPFSATNTIFFIDSNERQLSTYVNGNDDFILQKTEIGGSGLTWITATTNGSIVNFEVDENTTSVERQMLIQIVSNPKKTSIPIYITQEGNGIPSMSFDDANNSQYLNTILIGKQ